MAAVPQCAARSVAAQRCAVAAVRDVAARRYAAAVLVSGVLRVAERRCAAAAVRDVAARRCAAAVVVSGVLRVEERVLRAVADLVFSVPAKTRSWSARAKQHPEVTQWNHLFEP